MSHNPNARDGRGVHVRSEQEPQNKDFTETIVSFGFSSVGSGGGTEQRILEQLPVLQGDSKHGSENPRLVPASPVRRVERVILQLRAELRPFPIREFHCRDCIK